MCSPDASDARGSSATDMATTIIKKAVGSSLKTTESTEVRTCADEKPGSFLSEDEGGITRT
jgi:hypothetical protein